MLARQQLKTLAAFDSGGFPVVSFYLNVDGSRYSPIQNVERAHQLVRQARESLPGRNLSPAARQSVERDLDHITRFVGAEFEYGPPRGLALFSCAANGFSQTYPLPRPVKDRIEIDAHPYLRPLAVLLDEFSRYGVVLVDREKARIFVVDLGEITELDRVFDDVPSRIRVGTWYGLADDKIERSIEGHIRRHLKHVAGVLHHVVERENLSRILVGGSPDEVPVFLRTLPRELAHRVVGEIGAIMMIAPPHEVLSHSLKAIAEIERREEAALVAQIREAGGPSGYAVAGLEETLRALHFDAVRVLVVERDRVQPGYACARCGRLFSAQFPCPVCGNQEPEPVNDIIEEAIETAFRLDAETQFISGAPEWTSAGGIGALLRFTLPTARSEAVAAAS